MADENWQKVRRVFNAALRGSREERQPYIRYACGNDKDLLTEVESPLSSLNKFDSTRNKQKSYD